MQEILQPRYLQGLKPHDFFKRVWYYQQENFTFFGMLFIVMQVVILFVILFLVIVLSMVWPPDSPWAPWWRTNKKTAQAMCKLAHVKKGDIVYDLGSGEGTALIVAAKELKVQGIGIEIDPLRFLFSTLIIHIIRVHTLIHIKRKDFFQEDISKATVVFVYLVPKTLNRLLPKFKKELRKGTRIVSYRYKINLPLKKYDKKNNLRLYII